jgi:hypothetical protein
MFRIDLFSDAHSLLTDTHLQKLLAAAKQRRRANIKDNTTKDGTYQYE